MYIYIYIYISLDTYTRTCERIKSSCTNMYNTVIIYRVCLRVCLRGGVGCLEAVGMGELSVRGFRHVGRSNPQLPQTRLARRAAGAAVFFFCFAWSCGFDPMGPSRRFLFFFFSSFFLGGEGGFCMVLRFQGWKRNAACLVIESGAMVRPLQKAQAGLG